jgi:hypothetical protein
MIDDFRLMIDDYGLLSERAAVAVKNVLVSSSSGGGFHSAI